MPSGDTAGVAAGITFTACTRTDAITIGQEMRWSRADRTTVRPRSPTAAPTDSRSRTVSRARAAMAGNDSVNDRRGQSVWSQRQRRLCNRSSQCRPATGRSRGQVLVHSLTLMACTPRLGQIRARSSVVRRTSGQPLACTLTDTTSTRPTQATRSYRWARRWLSAVIFMSRQHEGSQRAADMPQGSRY